MKFCLHKAEVLIGKNVTGVSCDNHYSRCSKAWKLEVHTLMLLLFAYFGG